MIFSHFDYFDELLDAALGAGEASWNHHERVSYVRIKVQFYRRHVHRNTVCVYIHLCVYESPQPRCCCSGCGCGCGGGGGGVGD